MLVRKLITHNNIVPFLLSSKYFIKQDSERLRTFQVPQQNIIPDIPKQIFDEELLLTLIRMKTAFEKLKQLQPLKEKTKELTKKPQRLTQVLDEDKQTEKKKQQEPIVPGVGAIELQGLKKLQIQTSYGYFIFQGERQLSTFYYTSPFSGVYKYYYDLKSKQWKSNKDEHIMQQNVSREVQGKFYAFLDI